MSSRVFLVARREVVERVRTRAYLLSTLALVAGVVAAAIVPHFLEDKQRQYELGLAGTTPSGISTALAVTAHSTGDQIDLRPVPSARVSAELERGSVQAVLVDGHELVVRRDADPRLRALVQTAVARAQLAVLLERAGVREAAVPRVEVRRLETGSAGAATGNVAIGAAVLLYAALIFSGAWVATGIVEEKSSRVVEVILSAVPPRDLLAGKLLGVGIVALAQVGAAAAAGATAALSVGSLELPDRIPFAAASLVGWFAVGYALYACAFAVAASLVSRQEDAPAVTTPINVVLGAAFLTAMAVAEEPAGTLTRILSLTPPFAPLLMPVRTATGDVAAWEPAVALLLALAALAGLVRLAAHVYAGSALRIGPRISLRGLGRLPT